MAQTKKSNGTVLRKFHSEAQREKCKKLLVDGTITQAQYDEMHKNTPSQHPLPERKK